MVCSGVMEMFMVGVLDFCNRQVVDVLERNFEGRFGGKERHWGWF